MIQPDLGSYTDIAELNIVTMSLSLQIHIRKITAVDLRRPRGSQKIVYLPLADLPITPTHYSMQWALW